MRTQRKDTSVREARIVDLARLQCHVDGECEIDDTAVVSEGNDNGAYVQAWVWVDFEGTDLDKAGIRTRPSRLARYKSEGSCAWNNNGFAQKDPGKERDDQKPSRFDEQYPINENYLCDGASDAATVGELLARLKKQLSYPVRYEISPEDAAKPINLRRVTKTAEKLLIHAARTLGNSWQLMRFKSHFTLFQQRYPKFYAHGVQLHP